MALRPALPFVCLWLSCRAAAPDHAIGAGLLDCAREVPVGSIADAVTLVNGLPRPVEAPCVLAALPRPLAVVATTGTFSAQPAGGPKSPRLFLMLDGLVASVVPSGAGAELLEFGEWTDARHTLKGEIVFPVRRALEPDAPFTQVARASTPTRCGLCHTDETPLASTPGGFTSLAYRPDTTTLVPLAALEAEHRSCIALGDTSARCDTFHALFDFGEVTQGAFDPGVATFGH